MTASITRVQLETLQAVSRGEVSKVNHTGADFGTWRIGGYRGRAVTVPVEALLRKELARLADEPVDGRLYATATPAGTAELSKAAHRRH